MEMITKTFVQVNSADDCEGRYYSWKDVDIAYEEVIDKLDGFWTGVRVVEKTFNPETFKTTYKVLKETNHEWISFGKWENVETIYTE
jgi:hypothetical protein